MGGGRGEDGTGKAEMLCEHHLKKTKAQNPGR